LAEAEGRQQSEDEEGAGEGAKPRGQRPGVPEQEQRPGQVQRGDAVARLGAGCRGVGQHCRHRRGAVGEGRAEDALGADRGKQQIDEVAHQRSDDEHRQRRPPLGRVGALVEDQQEDEGARHRDVGEHRGEAEQGHRVEQPPDYEAELAAQGVVGRVEESVIRRRAKHDAEA